MLANPGVNPFIDPTEWQRFADTLTEEFKAFMAMGN